MTDSAKAAREARVIARTALKGALATQRRGAGNKATGQPYVSKVGVAADEHGAPLFLFSTLAAHTQDLLADNRASVLLEVPTTASNPLEGARCTLMGRVKKLEGDAAVAAKAAYLTRHPGAALYAGFGDFAMWRMDIDKVQFVGGFGVAKWAKGAEYLCALDASPDALKRQLASLNGEKLDDLRAVVAHQCGRSVRGWKALAIDADGLVLVGPKAAQMRLDFASPAKDMRAWRARFQTWLKHARS